MNNSRHYYELYRSTATELDLAREALHDIDTALGATTTWEREPGTLAELRGAILAEVTRLREIAEEAGR